MTEAQALRIALRHLAKEKFLLLVDNRQPSFVTLLTGEPIRGSWFSHPRGKVIHNTSNRLAERRELLALKLIDGKYTYVAPAMRDAAYAIAAGGAAWQEKKLTPPARRLLALLARKGTVPVTAAIKKDAALLEKLLLCASEEEHTPGGKHVKVLVSWKKLAEKLGHRVKELSREDAERAWEERVREFNRRHGSEFRLPWQKR
jgi:hypothetical protein